MRPPLLPAALLLAAFAGCDLNPVSAYEERALQVAREAGLGEFAVHSSRSTLMKAQGRLVHMTIPGDDVAVVSLELSGALACRGAETCEAAVTDAHAYALASAAEARRVMAAFDGCALELFAVDELHLIAAPQPHHRRVDMRLVIDRQLTRQNLAETRQALGECMERLSASRRAAGTRWSSVPAAVNAVLVALPPTAPAEPPLLIGWRERLKEAWGGDERRYHVAWYELSEGKALERELRLVQPFDERRELEASLARAADACLEQCHPALTALPHLMVEQSIRDGDPLRIRRLVLAAPRSEPGAERPRADAAVALTHDLRTGEVTDFALIPNVRTGSGLFRIDLLD